MRCIVVPSNVKDVYRLAETLRENDRMEIEALGVDVRTALRRSYREGICRKTYFIDGELAAMSGLCGTMIGDIGEPYLMTAPVAEKMPLTFVRHAKMAVDEMLEHKIRLEGFVIASYTKACRLLEVLGFTLEQPKPIGPKGIMFHRYFKVRDF